MAKEKKADKKPNVFARVFGAIGKFFRDLNAEVRKVVWPSKKQVMNNTVVVLVMCIISGAVLFAADALFAAIPDLLIKLATRS